MHQGAFTQVFLRNPPFGRTAQERARAGSYALLAQCPAPSFPPLNGSVGRSQNTVQALIPKTPIFKKNLGLRPKPLFENLRFGTPPARARSLPPKKEKTNQNQENKKIKTTLKSFKMKINYPQLLIFSILILMGCNSPEKSFNRALESRSIEDFQKVIDNYPESEFSQQAEGKIGEINFWSEIDSSLLEKNYLSYLDSFPDGLFLTEANSFLELITAYKKARKEDFIESYTAFQEKYPNSLYQDSINQRLPILESALIGYQRLKDNDDIASLESYIKEFAGTGYSKALQAKADSLTIYQYIEQLSSKDVIERANAIEGLEKLEDKALAAVPHLIPLLSDDSGFSVSFSLGFYFTSVSTYTEDALEKITGQSFGKNKRKWTEWWENEGTKPEKIQ